LALSRSIIKGFRLLEIELGHLDMNLRPAQIHGHFWRLPALQRVDRFQIGQQLPAFT